MTQQPPTHTEWAVRHSQGVIYLNAAHRPMTREQAEEWAAANAARDESRKPSARGRTQLLTRQVTDWTEVPDQPTVTATVKPCQIVGTSTATVDATNATYDQVVDAALAALRETRDSLWGWGIRGMRRDEAPELLTGTYIVYADRD